MSLLREFRFECRGWYCATAALAFVSFLAFAGCTAVTQEEREETARTLVDTLKDETEAYFRDNPGPLSLTNALDLAVERTLKLTQRELESHLARVNRDVKFSAFLPNVELMYGRVLGSGVVDTPLFDVKSSGFSMQNMAMLVTQPVFTPVAWIMFAESSYGVRISDLVRDRARQLLVVQVATCFYKAAVAERTVKTYELQLESGRELTNRVTRLVAEGYALPGDRVRAEARMAADELGLLQARNAWQKARGELADVLKFWPLADFGVDGDSILSLPRLEDKPVEEWVWEGLMNRKDLQAGDETVALRKAQVIEALAGFLPNVVLGGGGANVTLEEISVRGWAGALTGVWSVFEGFRTVQQYRAARAKREAEFKLNEDRKMAVIVSVADCWRNWREAKERVATTEKLREAATLDHREAEKRYDDGQETLSKVLDKLTVRDEAEVKFANAAYAEALSALMLKLAVGGEIK